MTADYLRHLAGAATATLGDVQHPHAGQAGRTPTPAPSGLPREEPAPPGPAALSPAALGPVALGPVEPAPEEPTPAPGRPDPGSSGARLGAGAEPGVVEAKPGPDTSAVPTPERAAVDPSAPAAATPLPAPPATSLSGTPVAGPADTAHASGRAAHAGTAPVPGRERRSTPDHASAPLRHAGIRAVQDLGVRRAGDRAHRRPANPEDVDPRLREHLDDVGQRLLAAHPPAAAGTPGPATADPPPAERQPAEPPPVTAVTATSRVMPPPEAGGPTAYPAPAPPRDGRLAATPEPTLTIEHLEVRVVVEPPPRQQAAPPPRPPARTRPAWSDSARRYLRGR